MNAESILLQTIEAHREHSSFESGCPVYRQWFAMNRGERAAIARWTRGYPGHDAIARFVMFIAWATHGVPFFERADFVRDGR